MTFGFIQTIYFLLGQQASDSHSVVIAFNYVGLVSSLILATACFLSLFIVYGEKIALTVSALFFFSPGFLEVFQSGHPTLLSLALFFASIGAFESYNSDKHLSNFKFFYAALAVILFTFACSVRGDIVLFFPWFVLIPLKKIADGNFKNAAVNIAIRALLCSTALVLSRLIAYQLLDPSKSLQEAPFFETWYKLNNLPIGAVALSSALGFLTVVALLFTVIIYCISGRRSVNLLRLVGPAITITIGLIVWLPNPVPARHFLPVIFCTCLLLVFMIDEMVELSKKTILILCVTVIVANQFLSDFVEPAIVEYHGQKLAIDQRFIVPAPIGNTYWRSQMTIASKMRAAEFGDRIANATCVVNLIVISSEAPLLLMSFYKRGMKPEKLSYTAYHGMKRIEMIFDSRQIDIIFQDTGARMDALPIVLADPRYIDYKIIRDPFVQLRTETLEIPKERTTSLSCQE
ncbi:hypothetical protein [Methylobacterium longum]|uniref:Glycosyltransferase RgtA/B/C/D-like domain-containing protein n=1 Tax=Methylobacterium longum TaxID=767694 RepID=A0ABT8APC8_9HYPH|nr:hypothetical protein [Methylobacterium longum]MDN3571310.1 hypothetical protein [Methylobacterium longum]